MYTNHRDQKVKRVNKTSLLNQIKGFSSLLSDSSNYWKGTLSNLGNNFCNCSRVDEIDNEDITNNYRKEKEVSEIANNTDKDEMTDHINNNVTNNLAMEDSINHFMNQKIWTPEEDQILINFVNANNTKSWKKISTILGNKNPQQCSYRYGKLAKTLNKRKWNKSEDFIIIEMVDLIGKNWEFIASRVEGRTANEIQERYEKTLNSKLKRSKFEKEEDESILKFHNQFGNNWNEIAKLIPERSASMIKNRYYSFLKKKCNKDTAYDSLERISETRSNSSSITNSNKANINGDYSLPNPKTEFSHHPDINSKTISNNDSSTLKNFQEKQMKEVKDSDYIYKNNFDNEFNINNEEMGIHLEFLNFDKNKIGSNSVITMQRSQVYNDMKSRQNDNNKENLYMNFNNEFEKNMTFDNFEEANIIPKDLIKIQTDSPKLSRNNQDNNMVIDSVDYSNNFDESYKNAFRFRQPYFEVNDNENDEINFSDHNYSHTNNIIDLITENKINLNIQNNESLMNQINVFQNVYEKIKDDDIKFMHFISKSSIYTNYKEIGLADALSYKNNFFGNIKNFDEKTEELLIKIRNLQQEHLQLSSGNHIDIDSNSRSQILRSSLFSQITIFIELITTTQRKIKFIQQSLNEISKFNEFH